MNPDPLVSVAAVSHEAPHVPTLPDAVTRLAGFRPSEAVAVVGGGRCKLLIGYGEGLPVRRTVRPGPVRSMMTELIKLVSFFLKKICEKKKTFSLSRFTIS